MKKNKKIIKRILHKSFLKKIMNLIINELLKYNIYFEECIDKKLSVKTGI